MPESNWRIQGDYFETCNCDFLCPCIYTNMAAEPTHGVCKVAIVHRVNEGHLDDVSLDGVSFVVAAMVDGPMANGNWKIGLIIDDKASDAQVEAIGKICSGDLGGPMEHMAPLVGEFAGVERAGIEIDQKPMAFTVRAGDFLNHGAEAMPSALDPDDPIYIDNTAHPANKRLALAKGTHSHLHAFGIDWDDADGGHNGHFAPFDWSPA